MSHQKDEKAESRICLFAIDEDKVQISRALEFPYQAASASNSVKWPTSPSSFISSRLQIRVQTTLECHALRVLSIIASKGIGNVP